MQARLRVVWESESKRREGEHQGLSNAKQQAVVPAGRMLADTGLSTKASCPTFGYAVASYMDENLTLHVFYGAWRNILANASRGASPVTRFSRRRTASY